VTANLLARKRRAEKVAGRVFNVAGGQSISVLQLVEELNRLTGRPIAARVLNRPASVTSEPPWPIFLPPGAN